MISNLVVYANNDRRGSVSVVASLGEPTRGALPNRTTTRQNIFAQRSALGKPNRLLCYALSSSLVLRRICDPTIQPLFSNHIVFVWGAHSGCMQALMCAWGGWDSTPRELTLVTVKLPMLGGYRSNLRSAG